MSSLTPISSLSSYDVNALSFARSMIVVVAVVLHYTAVFLSVDASKRLAEDADQVKKMYAAGMGGANPGAASESTLTEALNPTGDAEAAAPAPAPAPAPAAAPERWLRWARINDNQKENFPLAILTFVIAIGTVLDGQAEMSTTSNNYYSIAALTWLMWIWIVSRVFYVYAYLNAWQPFRSLFYGLSLVSVLMAAGVAIYGSSTFYLQYTESIIPGNN